MVTRALVVPDSAESTTIFFPGVSRQRLATLFIRSGLPTEVPPNFRINIFRQLFATGKYREEKGVDQYVEEILLTRPTSYQKQRPPNGTAFALCIVCKLLLVVVFHFLKLYVGDVVIG